MAVSSVYLFIYLVFTYLIIYLFIYLFIESVIRGLALAERVTQQSFVRESSAPRSRPLPFHIPHQTKTLTHCSDDILSLDNPARQTPALYVHLAQNENKNENEGEGEPVSGLTGICVHQFSFLL